MSKELTTEEIDAKTQEVLDVLHGLDHSTCCVIVAASLLTVIRSFGNVLVEAAEKNKPETVEQVRRVVESVETSAFPIINWITRTDEDMHPERYERARLEMLDDSINEAFNTEENNE